MSKHSTEPSKYLESVGLKKFRDVEKFWSYMEKKHGEKTCQDLDQGLELLSAGKPESFYDAIYDNLDVSCDVASMRTNLYCKFLEYFTQAFPKLDGTLLDIGCGNGLLTCFYALRYPQAKVIGIDKAEGAINCSRLLAQRLGLENVEFVVVNCDSKEWPLAERSIDLAISITGLDPSKDTACKRTTELLDWANHAGSDIQIKAVRNLSRYIKPSGSFISVDRLPHCEDEFLWLSGLQNACMGIDFDASTDFSFTDLGTTETLPVIVSVQGREKLSPADLLSYCVERRGGLEALGVGDKNEALAELLFSTINPKSLIAGWKVTYHDGSGVAHYEVWSSGVFALLYIWTNRGYRELKFAPSYQLRSIVQKTERQMDSFKQAAALSRYDQDLLTVP